MYADTWREVNKMGRPTQDVNLANGFLKLLDAKAEQFCFRTLVDGATKRSDLIGNFVGGFDALAPKLIERNNAGAGVFVVVNDGGHKKEKINRVRAVFADTDGAPLQPIVEALPPSYVVNTSPGKWHIYWRVTPDFPLNQFAPVQRAIAEKFGTDTSVVDLPRLMRVPGFYHNKNEPFLVRITDFDRALHMYNREEIIAGLKLSVNARPTITTNRPSQLADRPRSKILHDMVRGGFSKAEIEHMLRYIDPSCKRKEWMDVLFVLAYELGEDGRELGDRWSSGELWEENDHAA